MSGTRRAWVFTVGVLGLVAVACGCSRRPYGTVPIRGRVTFGGKPPPARCEVYFVPVDTGRTSEAALTPRPGVGYVDSAGTFEVTSFQPGDGLLPGTYEVRIECWRTTPQVDHGQPGEVTGTSFIPAGFAVPPLVVPSAGVASLRCDIDVPSPARG